MEINTKDNGLLMNLMEEVDTYLINMKFYKDNFKKGYLYLMNCFKMNFNKK